MRGITAYLQEIFSAVPLQRCRKELAVQHDVIESPKFPLVAAEDNLVLASFFNTDAVVCEALTRMEVEDKKQASPLEDNDFVGFVFKRDVSLR